MVTEAKSFLRRQGAILGVQVSHPLCCLGLTRCTFSSTSSHKSNAHHASDTGEKGLRECKNRKTPLLTL